MFRLIRLNIKTFFKSKAFATLFLMVQAVMLICVFYALSETSGAFSSSEASMDRTFFVESENVISNDNIDAFAQKYAGKTASIVVYSENTCAYLKGSPTLSAGKSPQSENEVVVPHQLIGSKILGEMLELDGKEYKIVGITGLFSNDVYYIVGGEFNKEIFNVRLVFKNVPSEKLLLQTVADAEDLTSSKLTVYVPEKSETAGLSLVKSMLFFIIILMGISGITMAYMFDYLLNTRKELYQSAELVGADKESINLALFFESIIYALIAFVISIGLYFLSRTFIKNYLISILGVGVFAAILMIYLASVCICVMLKYHKFSKKIDLARVKW